MNIMRQSIVILLLIAAYTFPMFAQEGEFTIGQGAGGINFLLTFPQGEFKENSDRVGYGLGLEGAYVFPGLPAAAGIAGTFATYGSRTFNVPFSGTVQLVNVDLTTSNNIATGHIFLRLQPQEGMFRPYFEGLLGMHVFWTESSVEDERYEDSEIAGSTNLSDVAFSYGGGGGIQFLLSSGETDEPGEGVELLLDLKVRFLYGGEAEYFDKESITFDGNGIPVLRRENALISTTDMLQTMIGLAVRF